MAIDTSAIASTGGGQAQPNAAGPQPNPTVQAPTQGVAQMIQAILAGNDAYNKANPTQALSPGSPIPGAQGPTSVGGPNGPAPLFQPTDPGSMSGGLGNGPVPMPMPRPAGAPGMSPYPDNGTGGVSMDPVSAALMSPIPGMSGT